MMDLKEKLKYYKKSGSANVGAPSQHSGEVKLSPSVKSLLEYFNAELLTDSAAPVIKIENDFPCEQTLQPISLKRLSKLQFQNEIQPSECLFFDLETTGLSGGAGTYPFLLGFGYFEENTLRIVQYFLPDFGRDSFVLEHLKPLLQRKRILISYNGKSYDLPLLKSRAIMNRLKLDLDRMEHLDLLHLARRIWKDSQARCDLNSVEALQLGFSRPTDIPGWQIPQAYLNFIRTGVIHEMIAAIEHNVQDIYSLAKLLLHLAQIEHHPENLNDIPALLRLAQLAFEIDDFDYFLQIEKKIIKFPMNEISPFLFLKSKFFKRKREWAKAVELWEKLLNQRSYRFFALEELAKYYEHTAKKYDMALEYCNMALHFFAALETLQPYALDADLKKNFVKRKERIMRKLF